MSPTNFTARTLAASVALTTSLALSACVVDATGDGEDAGETAGDGDGDPTGGDGDPTGDGDGDPATGDGDGDSTGDGDGDGDDGKPELGATPNVLCEAAVFNLGVIVDEIASGSPDAAAIEAAYVGTGLQEFVQLAGAVTGRVEDGVLIDDAAISTAIAAAQDGGDVLDLIDAEHRIYLTMFMYIRHEITDVSATLPDPNNDPALLYQRWDAAYCYWDGGLRPLGQAADAVGLSGDTIEADVDAAFSRGHAGIEGEAAWAIDELEVPAAKQQAEKSMYTLAHRLVWRWASDAAAEADPELAAVYARNAHGAFQIIEDRINSKNTPAIATIEAALLGDPGQIDAAQILLDMNIAFAKRTRKYTDLALPSVGDLMGTPAGFHGANEGATYSKLVEPFMLDLDGFDQDAYRATWAAWIDAIANDDLAAGEAAAAELTDWNCQLQAALGIAECTADIDEI